MQSILFLPKRYVNSFLLSIISICILSGCAAVNESPTRYGYSFVTMPGVQLGTSNNSAHAVLGYYKFDFKGGGGHNNFYQFGAQLRRQLGSSTPNGLWIGGEISYLRIRNTFDNSNMKPSASGFTVGPAVGYRFQLGKVPFNVYAVPSFLSRGKFDGAGEGSSGYLGRFAFDIPFMSLLSKKGR